MKATARLPWYVIGMMGFSLLASSVMANPVVIAHRGYSAVAPENTIASIVAAAPYAWGAEIDIRNTSDREYILMHDTTVDRTTNGTGSVSGLSFDYIRTLDAGSWFSSAYVDEQVPTVLEAIDASATNDLKLCVEIKAGAASELYGILSPYSEDIEVHSFDWGLLQSIADLGGDFTYVAIGSGNLDAAVESLPSCIDKVSWNYPGITQSSIDTLHDMNKEVYAWTVDSTSVALSLADKGVDGIITNNPEGISGVLPPVPEPSVVTLLSAFALFGLFVRKRRTV